MNTTDWSRFPVATIGWGTFLKRALIHADLLRAALRLAGPREPILEVGVGSGAQSAFLSRYRPVRALERDLRILQQALPNLRRFGREIEVVAGDAFALPFEDQSFAVAISQGLMEHFSDDSISRLLAEQLRVCRSVVFSVPSHHYPRQDVGDERLMSPAEWERNLRGLLPTEEYRIEVRHPRMDLEALKYSARAGRWLGSFAVVVEITPHGTPASGGRAAASGGLP